MALNGILLIGCLPKDTMEVEKTEVNDPIPECWNPEKMFHIHCA